MRAGDHHKTNKMFRARIYAQFFTIVVMVGGSIYYADERAKQKQFEGMLSDRQAKEKQQAWIRELEIREQEEKVERDRKAAIRGKRATDVAASDAVKSVSSEVRSALEKTEQRRLGILEAVKDIKWR